MSKYMWSAKHNSFFPTATIGDYLLAGWDMSDLIEILDETASEFMDRSTGSKIMVVSIDGLPAWEDLPTPTKEEYKRMALADRDDRISKASQFINNKMWQSKLALGRLSDVDKSKFNLWLDYIDSLNAVDIESYPDTEWPMEPE